jgi:IS4 transposase
MEPQRLMAHHQASDLFIIYVLKGKERKRRKGYLNNEPKLFKFDEKLHKVHISKNPNKI